MEISEQNIRRLLNILGEVSVGTTGNLFTNQFCAGNLTKTLVHTFGYTREAELCQAT
jgi:hypothetical protein